MSSSPTPNPEHKNKEVIMDINLDSGRYSLGPVESGRSILSVGSGRAGVGSVSSRKFMARRNKVDIEPLNDDFTLSLEVECSGYDVSKKTGEGFSLTWEELGVSAANPRGGRLEILSGLCGFAVPGEVLAIMGPSGCGKSTLLDTLAGRLGSNLIQKGDILINGRKQKLAYGTSAYVTQDDVLMTTLTVREAVYYSAQLQLPDTMSNSDKKERAETTIKEMGLEKAMDTRIGGWASKGISGGQKRRVSICIEILTRPQLLFLDEPTSGLDSAASFHVMNRIAKLAVHEKMTVVASIHQPSSEVFELFNGLCLLAYGKTVYFGSASMANQFFASSGFPCSPHRNPSDHFLKTINKDFDKDTEDASKLKSTTTAQAIEILTDSYSSSLISEQVTQKISEIHQKGGCSVKKRSQAGFFTQIMVLTRRSFLNMFRDLGYYWFRFFIYIILSIALGTVFFDLGYGYESIQARGSVLLFISVFLTFMSISGFPSFVEEMKIFERERLNGHYGVSAYTIASTLSSTPYLILISVVPGVTVYYLAKLQSSAGHFFYFAAVLLMCLMLVEGMMMVVASIIPNYLMGIIIGSGIQATMILTCGFFRLPNDLPKPVWKYPLYYVAFHKYSNDGFYKNEFIGLSFPNIRAGGNATISGREVLVDYWQLEMGYSKWVDLYVLMGMVVLYRVLFIVNLKIGEKIKKMRGSCLSFD